ncbi:hypothetical protein ACLB2K_065719 [Fragaria x ananassa]
MSISTSFESVSPSSKAVGICFSKTLFRVDFLYFCINNFNALWKLFTCRFYCIALRTSLYLAYLIFGYLITFSFEPPPSFLDSLLFVIVTVTTIGYGNVTPNTNVAKYLVVAFVLLGTVMSAVFGNPLGDLVNAVGDKLEKWFFKSIKITSDKTKRMLKFFFAIGWIVFVVGTGFLGIWIWDATEMRDTTKMNDNGVNATNHNGANATMHNGVNATHLVNATYFSVISAFTIGYGDFHFSAIAGKRFALVWLPLGTAIVGSATSYLCGRRLCAVCIWKDKKTKSLMEVETMIVPGLVFGNGILVEANPILKKHCLEHTDAETSLKFLSAILSSRIYECEFVQRRDLVPAPAFSRACSSSPEEVEILLNREHGSSYKWRGTYNFMANALIEKERRGFTCTFGKPAVMVACVAQLWNSSCKVATPDGYVPPPLPELPEQPEQPEQAVRRKLLRDILEYKATVVSHGTCIQESDDHAKSIAATENSTYVPSCDHTDIITGYGTIGVEIITQMVRGGKIDNLHAIFVPIGDGNCIAGIAAYVKRVFPKVKVFGVEERTRSVMAWSFYKGKRVCLVKQNGEVLVEAIGEECFSICVEFLDGIMIVDEDAISTANEEIRKEIDGDVSALCIAGVQCYCSEYVGEVRNKTIVAVIDECHHTSEFSVNLGLVEV